MTLRNRAVFGFLALIWCSWASVTVARHFAGQPDRGMQFLLLSPALACIIAIAGLMCEIGWVHKTRLPVGYPPHSLPLPIRVLELAGIVFLAWRVLWLWFSWDGMFYFPAGIMLALTIWRQKQTPQQALWAERTGAPRWGIPLATRLSREYQKRPSPEMYPPGPRIISPEP